jgi:hypothetical protein
LKKTTLLLINKFLRVKEKQICVVSTAVPHVVVDTLCDRQKKKKHLTNFKTNVKKGRAQKKGLVFNNHWRADREIRGKKKGTQKVKKSQLQSNSRGNNGWGETAVFSSLHRPQ